MINRVNIIRLLDGYIEAEITEGLHLVADCIDRSFSSLNYFSPYIRKAGEITESCIENEG